ncbi:hypothetical protein MBT84_00830 [Streptomyces sp. MBT84]|nr:hypothetical protein [Streptomyces sp. MBT84]
MQRNAALHPPHPRIPARWEAGPGPARRRNPALPPPVGGPGPDLHPLEVLVLGSARCGRRSWTSVPLCDVVLCLVCCGVWLWVSPHVEPGLVLCLV